MHIRGYLWREDVIDKLWWKHKVTIEEVEEIFDNQPRVEKIEKGRYQGEDVYAALGQTSAGRYLVVIFIYKHDQRALVNTAREMTSRERKRYGRKR
ncbi:MAG: BrnT family toxin [Anaerolineales bacterium]|nr:BrnT family toxin [Anaerolineales bacterium]